MNKIKFYDNGSYRQIKYNNVIHYDVDEDLFNKFKNTYEENAILQQRINKALHYTELLIELIEQQPTGNDEWLLSRLKGIIVDLKGERK